MEGKGPAPWGFLPKALRVGRRERAPQGTQQLSQNYLGSIYVASTSAISLYLLSPGKQTHFVRKLRTKRLNLPNQQ